MTHDGRVAQYARVVELVDSLDSGSSVQYVRGGSSPPSRTILFSLNPLRCNRFRESDVLGFKRIFAEVCRLKTICRFHSRICPLGALDKSSVIRFVPNVFVCFAGFEGEYPSIFN